jgi:hypothetical protein
MLGWEVSGCISSRSWYSFGADSGNSRLDHRLLRTLRWRPESKGSKKLYSGCAGAGWWNREPSVVVVREHAAPCSPCRLLAR